MSEQLGLQTLKSVKMSEGLYCVGEYRGTEARESKGNTYYKLKVLIGDVVKKFDIKPEQYGQLTGVHTGKPIIVRYYEFLSKFGGMNYVCNEFVVQN